MRPWRSPRTSPEIDALPVERNIFTVTELAPGLTNNTPNNNQVVINGAFAYDNVFLIDGVDVNDNLFGTVHNLFIEDAIEEMQVLTSGISAEYGRFSGGVINTITKSGANTFSGSFRANLYKPDWTVRTPFETASGQERTGSLANNASYETTAGGPIVQDRLWFFYANRVERESESETFAETGMGYDRELRNDRNLIKFTGTIAAGHGLEGSYMRNSTERLEPTFPFSIDPNTFINPSLPNDLWVVTYRAAVTSQLFAEFQVSRKRLAIEGVGGTLTDIRESPFLGLTQTTANGLPHHYNGPYFDAQDPEERNNRQITGNATYYLSTRGLGTHSLKGGFDLAGDYALPVDQRGRQTRQFSAPQGSRVGYLQFGSWQRGRSRYRRSLAIQLRAGVQPEGHESAAQRNTAGHHPVAGVRERSVASRPVLLSRAWVRAIQRIRPFRFVVPVHHPDLAVVQTLDQG